MITTVPRAALSAGRNARSTLNGPLRFAPIMRSQDSGVSSCRRRSVMFVPAAMISASTRSNGAANASTASRSVKSSRCAVTPGSVDLAPRGGVHGVAGVGERPRGRQADARTTRRRRRPCGSRLPPRAGQEDLELGRRRALGEPRELPPARPPAAAPR